MSRLKRVFKVHEKRIFLFCFFLLSILLPLSLYAVVTDMTFDERSEASATGMSCGGWCGSVGASFTHPPFCLCDGSPGSEWVRQSGPVTTADGCPSCASWTHTRISCSSLCNLIKTTPQFAQYFPNNAKDLRCECSSTLADYKRYGNAINWTVHCAPCNFFVPDKEPAPLNGSCGSRNNNYSYNVSNWTSGSS
jgi:hypothetical protein